MNTKEDVLGTPEPGHEYRWVIQYREDNSLEITEGYYTNEEELRQEYDDIDILGPIVATARSTTERVEIWFTNIYPPEITVRMVPKNAWYVGHRTFEGAKAALLEELTRKHDHYAQRAAGFADRVRKARLITEANVNRGE